MDMLAFEIRRRSGEETRTIIEALPDILSDGDQGPPSPHTMPRNLPVEPPDIPMEGRRSIDRVLADDFLAHLPQVNDDELEAIQLMLTIAEKGVSEQRRSVYEALDVLNREVARRYTEGIVSVTDLLDQ
ncbi:MAG: hypothetical protein QNJ75_09585 [Acidimicrobiia bacterium]|nr:hypothetical protein [Acidimicrobiia bacterium]